MIGDFKNKAKVSHAKRKGRDGEKMGGKNIVILATNGVASQPPERRATGTPTARAKIERLLRT